jgi:hypothetical protein
MLSEPFQLILAAGAFAAIAWVLRRIIPRASCPSCGSRRWILMGDGGMKQCRDCAEIFYG